jgi:prevent-host-death family protein
MISVTEMRGNIRDILAQIGKTREPVIILQRSKPVAYLVDPETFEKSLAGTGEARSRREARQKSLDSVLRLRSEIVGRGGIQEDTTALVKRLRERQGRHE